VLPRGRAFECAITPRFFSHLVSPPGLRSTRAFLVFPFPEFLFEAPLCFFRLVLAMGEGIWYRGAFYLFIDSPFPRPHLFDILVINSLGFLAFFCSRARIPFYALGIRLESLRLSYQFCLESFLPNRRDVFLVLQWPLCALGNPTSTRLLPSQALPNLCTESLYLDTRRVLHLWNYAKSYNPLPPFPVKGVAK